MKRYLTFGIIFGTLVVIFVAISWFLFPAWKDPTSGGFWALIILVIVGVWTFMKDAVSVWKDLKEEEKDKQQKPSPPAKPDFFHEGWFLKHTYSGLANFSGRKKEQGLLSDWMEKPDAKPIYVIVALGGFGKTALVWYWLNHNEVPQRLKHVIWWSFYEDNNFETFVKESLEHLNLKPEISFQFRASGNSCKIYS